MPETQDNDIVALPQHFPGMRVGFLGGSFDPAHEGHRQVSLVALRALGLDQVWWLVSPQNPLKSNSPSSSLADRVRAARQVANHPRIRVTGIEATLGTNYTAETLGKLLPRLPGVSVVWMMGADNLAQFHRWKDWQAIAVRVPIAVFNRPGLALKALAARPRAPSRNGACLNGRPEILLPALPRPGPSCPDRIFPFRRRNSGPQGNRGPRLESFTRGCLSSRRTVATVRVDPMEGRRHAGLKGQKEGIER